MRNEVRIRMYRGILGDCFLIAHVSGERIRHMLIDCGALQNVKDKGGTLTPEVANSLGAARASIKDSDKRIAVIAADVARTVKNRGGELDRLVVTHEHYDHVSGFAVAKDIFADAALRIGELWLAWTEDPDDERARELQARSAQAKTAIALAGRVADLGADDALSEALSLSAFIGPLRLPGEAGAGGKMTTRETLSFLKDEAGAGAIRYLEPGTVLAAGDGIGLKTYVLGPPRSEHRLTKSSPSGGTKKEVYLVGPDEAASVERGARRRLLQLMSSGAGGFAMSPDEAKKWKTELAGDAMPFTRPYWRRYDQAQPPAGRSASAPRSGDRRDGEKDKAEASASLRRLIAQYESPDEGYRLIDEDLTGFAGSLALKLDSDTNNTSLALAFELPGGDVLLFPGDAQVGNWLSWADQHYPSSKPASEAVDIAEILRRVVFYKVGHHASHNATLKHGGLGMMTNPRLSAAIPVVEAVAKIQGLGRKTPGRGWKMPYKELYEELESRTRGRIVRGDGDKAAERAAFEEAPSHPTLPVELRYDDSADDLWVELVYPLD